MSVTVFIGLVGLVLGVKLSRFFAVCFATFVILTYTVVIGGALVVWCSKFLGG